MNNNKTISLELKDFDKFNLEKQMHESIYKINIGTVADHETENIIGILKDRECFSNGFLSKIEQRIKEIKTREDFEKIVSNLENLLGFKYKIKEKTFGDSDLRGDGKVGVINTIKEGEKSLDKEISDIAKIRFDGEESLEGAYVDNLTQEEYKKVVLEFFGGVIKNIFDIIDDQEKAEKIKNKEAEKVSKNKKPKVKVADSDLNNLDF